MSVWMQFIVAQDAIDAIVPARTPKETRERRRWRGFLTSMVAVEAALAILVPVVVVSGLVVLALTLYA